MAQENESEKESKKGARKLIWGIIGVLVAAAAVVGIVFGIVKLVNQKAKPQVGDYELTGMEANGEDQSSTLSMMKAFGLEVTLTVKDDKSGTMSLYGETVDFTFDNDNMTFDDETVPYTYKDGALTFAQDGTSMTFNLKQ